MRLPEWIRNERAATASLLSLAAIGCAVPRASRALEVAAAICIGRLLLADPAVRRVGACLGRRRSVVLTVLLGMFAFCHLVRVPGEGLRTYPFVEWSMYTRPSAHSTYMRFLATHASGRRAHYPFEELYGRAPRAMMRRFEPAAKAALGDSAPDRAAAARRGLEDDLRRLTDVYNRRHAADPIVTLEAEHCTFVTKEYHGRDSITARLAARATAGGSPGHATR